MVKGYIDPFENHFQQFYREYRILGIPVWRTVLFTEEVPTYAIIEMGCLGTCSWRSAAPQWMHDEANKNRN